MKIEIRERLRPFTHKKGALVPVPGAHLVLQAFPALLRIYDYSAGSLEIKETKEIPALLEQFTVTLDLERGYIVVSGRSNEGFLRFYISKDGITDQKLQQPLKAQRRLSFGVQKKQEWEAVVKRGELAEILPFWMRLGQLLPAVSNLPVGGAFEAVQKGAFKVAFQAGFSEFLLPRLEDTEFQGLNLSKLEKSGSPLALLTEGARLIESLFFKESEGTLYILPHCPSEIKCGKMTEVVTEEGLQLHFEWTKGTLRRVLIRGSQKMVQKVIFPRNLKRYRLRTSPNSKGIVCKTTEPVTLDGTALLLLDNFEK